MSDDVESLRSLRARQLIDYVSHAVESTYARLDHFGFDETSGRDIIDVTVEPQLVQHRAVAIQSLEPLRLLFRPDDDQPPAVLSRREDFPLDLVHTSFEPGLNGRGLCIWEENWDDVRRGLTAEALVERLRNWLSRTASGSLHDAGQPLEPMIPAISDTLVIPAGPPPAIWHVAEVRKRGRRYVLVVDNKPAAVEQPHAQLPVFTLTLPPQVQGALRARPYDLRALGQLVQELGSDFAKQFGDWLAAPAQLQANARNPLVIVTVPKQRAPGGSAEAWEVWAFLTTANLGQLGEAFGRSFAERDGTSRLRIPAASPECPPNDTLLGWRVVQRLDRAAARHFSGAGTSADHTLVALGAGAIGSNVILGTIRAGLGPWTVIDNDIVLPHNTVRQAQTDFAIGESKALTVGLLADSVLAEGGNSFVDADLLDFGDAREKVEAAFSQATLVVDFSASPSVLGGISDHQSVKRLASCFFNPTGTDLVVLAEDVERLLRLDEVEAQYLLAVADNPLLDGHLASARLDFIRYANACQDLSRPLPPWQVQALCGIAAGQIQKLLNFSDTVAQVWRLDPEHASVGTVTLPLAPVHRLAFADWRLTMSRAATSEMQALRRQAAPDETGGVLIGSFDLSRKVVHVVAALPAPPDSQQAPTYFIRGLRELKEKVDVIARLSIGNLRYVGEWHTHPDGARAWPSCHDEGVFQHLAAHLHCSGTPYLMAICGREETWLRGGWQSLTRSEAVIAHDHG